MSLNRRLHRLWSASRVESAQTGLRRWRERFADGRQIHIPSRLAVASQQAMLQRYRHLAGVLAQSELAEDRTLVVALVGMCQAALQPRAHGGARSRAQTKEVTHERSR